MGDGITKGMYGAFGGQYTSETPMIALEELGNTYEQIKDDADFQQELRFYLREYANHPPLLYYIREMSEELGGAEIHLKREDLNRTGVHKINNVLGQASLAKRTGKAKIIAETDTGQHGTASTTTAVPFDVECKVFMGAEDMRRQSLNAFKMELLGATVTGVSNGTGTLKDACNEAIHAWVSCCDDTFYALGPAVGLRPYPVAVRDPQKVISGGMKAQCLEKEGRLPDTVIARMDGGNNAIGTFYDFLKDEDVTLIGCEVAGRGVHTEQHAVTIARGSVGILHGMRSLFLQDDDGQIMPVYSISAGLDYPGIGPEHVDFAQSGRVQYVPVTDDETVVASLCLTKTEDTIPAIESGHALAYAMRLAPTMSKDSILAVTLSRRGDKDVKSVAEYLEVNIHKQSWCSIQEIEAGTKNSLHRLSDNR